MREALFVIPARLTRPFFTRLYVECERAIFNRFGVEVRPVVRSVSNPGEQFSAQEVIRVLEREFEYGSSIGALIVVPTDSRQLSHGVADVAVRHRLPVIALTLPFYCWPGQNTGRPPLVICESSKGTYELARAAAIEFRTRHPRKYHAHVLVMPGTSRRIDSMTRIRSFVAALCEFKLIENVANVEFLNPASWLRENARTVMRARIDAADRSIDIVFAANDEMALGIRDAILESFRRQKSKTRFVRDTLVFGFDAIVEARSLITVEKDHHLQGTVEQQLPLMANELANLLHDVLHDGGANGKIIQIPPRAILNPDVESKSQLTRSFPDNVPPLDASRIVPALTPLEQADETLVWVLESRVATELCIEMDSLRKYRERGAIRRHPAGDFGSDTGGRIWRFDPEAKQYFYTVASVLASQRR